jgi:hypothetical protein
VKREFYSRVENEEQFRSLGGFIEWKPNSTLDNTSITTSSEGGSNRIEEIRLGGTTVKLIFSN